MTFKPSPASTLVLAALTAGFVLLGNWQLNRAAEKQDREDAFEQEAVSIATSVGADSAPYSRVRLNGTFDTKRHFLIDNRVLFGRPGVHVMTPFHDDDTGIPVLVNRGWLPMPPDRSELPSVPTPEEALEIEGHLRAYPGVGVQIGEPDQPVSDQWPQLITYPDREAFGEALREDLTRWVLYLDEASPGGFDGRNWSVNAIAPGKHRAYAVQWFALAATAVGAWIVLGQRRARGTRR